MLSPPKPLDEIQPNLVCKLHEWSMQQQNNFGPAPWGPGEGLKGQVSLNFNNKVNFKDLLYLTLSVFLQIKYIKHIELDFCFDAWVMPQGGLGGGRGAQGLIFF